ncbi:glycoside hydrolase family 2 protein [Allomuricauda sp. SCSIO 65647]|uniref:glycoside hydrolase family 2 protein n=1 Tax=Allomuricauda sp. SCSIO 65647 TaxID=2908843 RepID=UPI001F2F0260|nr:sugar-binding domain-containing protein [Muricauda sp. SCSIO 65647]UJH67844.1 beta-galactosidase [Muricauda sp. SCSIO 65647]
MEKRMLFFLALLVISTVSAQWKPAGGKIKTPWAAQVNPESPLPKYPRPIMVRTDWKSLNGLWDYAITDYGSQKPQKFDGKILVPFPVESSLSGVMKQVGSDKEVWYETRFTVSPDWRDESILLHFGAVDWKADVWLNDIKIGSHSGGYAPFSFDISPFLALENQKLTVRVWDPTSDGPQPRGKQVNDPKGIWYTPVTGIWQTVWLEPVPDTRINALKTTPDIDLKAVKVAGDLHGALYGDIIEITVFDGQTKVAHTRASASEEVEVKMKNQKLWSPESPFLYDMTVRLLRNEQVVDEVKSYFAMRKISTKKDENGIMRMQLNNEDYFQFGTLDQGWWPDGLYTAPTDEALKYDIIKTKEYGFNMIRKHVKVEPQRWYRHCDEIGMLVWQDMPNGDRSNGWQNKKMFDGNELQRTPESEKIYRTEWQEIIDFLYSYPSIVVWVPFNEAWGQFKTEEITAWTKNHDPSRLVNSASGGNHIKTGDILDLHNYPEPDLYLYDADRVTVLGEYGGIGLPLEGHLWQQGKNWGYVKFKNSKEVTDEYVKYARILKKLVNGGFSAAIYTQTTDVEGEVNGLMTYDRRVDKLHVETVRQANRGVIAVLNEK